MGTTPLWVPLVVAVIGLVATIVGTIVGVIITQRRSDRREKIAWERERERERERWAREDAARTFELRRERLDPGNDLNSHGSSAASTGDPAASRRTADSSRCPRRRDAEVSG